MDIVSVTFQCLEQSALLTSFEKSFTADLYSVIIIDLNFVACSLTVSVICHKIKLDMGHI